MKLERVGNALHAPWFCLGLETTHQQATNLLLEIDIAVGIAQAGQVGVDFCDLASDDIHVFAGVQRDRQADTGAKRSRPHAARDDNRVGGDCSKGGAHRLGAPIAGVDGENLGLLEDFDAARARAFGKGLCDVCRVGLAVARQPNRANEIIGAHRRPFVSGLGRRQDFAIDALHARGGGHATEQCHAVLRARNRQRTTLLPAG